MNNREKGEVGEKRALDYLIGIGHTFITKNYRTSFGEIDIITSYKEYIVFTEVKARSTNKYGYPKEAVGYRKQDKIIKTSYIFLQKYGFKNCQIRYDVIEVFLKENSINHIVNAFPI